MNRTIFSVILFAAAVSVISCSSKTAADTAQVNTEDRSAIMRASLDYIEGWYNGDESRMNRALHPELIKRLIASNKVQTITKDTMLQYTRRGGGKNYTGTKANTITILDIHGSIATVMIYSAEYVDYLHLAKFDKEWTVMNVLWAYK